MSYLIDTNVLSELRRKQPDLTLVTRNIKDFAGLEVRLFNPWGQR